MRLFDALIAPFWIAQLATGAKSFCDNPFIGSQRLNRMGLHRRRILLAEKMAGHRRRRLSHLVATDDAEAFARDGFIVRENALPSDVFARLRDEVESGIFRATEMKQGNAVTRFIPLSPGVLAHKKELAAFVGGPLFQGGLRYVASTNGDPITYLHTVLTEPRKGRPDPQTAFHSDTFHATAKAWLFLRDVEEADGPFVYVPGSHRLTSGRLAWEQAQAEDASANPDRLHARGSFRAGPGEIEAMGYSAPRSFAVPANTLVIADTHGFHARGKSLRPSTRVAIYGSLRRNPFLPWCGLDPLMLPGLRGRQAELYEALQAARARLQKRQPPLVDVGEVRPGDPARR
ncbi:phytanoyl-CoA dioxygenase family protein [Stappia sp. F7233]|uniref:Phytanoyl-CoA dioxygenase family protein n=1 Tax=Stappia albiluteola TaxID=2758565 RepID=A0A839AGX7_9HYPH|nr:phytanoyl-CoA dioxygenase family protein [Stappia albiluteola]MBA5777789.1 phytanoyl-CoA dioxygenase family protein [Stappia albiluteola]